MPITFSTTVIIAPVNKHYQPFSTIPLAKYTRVDQHCNILLNTKYLILKAAEY